MNDQDLELARSHSEYRMGGGDFCFMEDELEAFLAERDAIKHKELLAIHEVLHCIGCEHEASEDDTWTVRGVKQLAERVQKSEAALNSQAKSVLDSLDFERLRSGQYRALNPDNQPIFDRYFATPQLEGKVRELEKDAERYRWLRNSASGEGICVVHIDYWSDEYLGQAHCEVYDAELLDKAIDKAMKGE
jgi:hypothetical protein